jgi:hypothetical protein
LANKFCSFMRPGQLFQWWWRVQFGSRERAVTDNPTFRSTTRRARRSKAQAGRGAVISWPRHDGDLDAEGASLLERQRLCRCGRKRLADRQIMELPPAEGPAPNTSRQRG